MRLLKWLTGSNEKAELLMAEAEKNLDDAEEMDSQSQATLDGEEFWFTRDEPTLEDIKAQIDNTKSEIIQEVHTTCSQT